MWFLIYDINIPQKPLGVKGLRVRITELCYAKSAFGAFLTFRSGGHFQVERFQDVGVTGSSDAADHIVVGQVGDGSLDCLGINPDDLPKWGIFYDPRCEDIDDFGTIFHVEKV